MTTYKDTIDYLYSRLPMFTRDGASAINKGMGRTKALCEALGNPHSTLKMIHVAGTNGKGSTSHMLASILSQAGYKTGLYTSPHLLDFRERIRIDGTMIPEQYVVDFVQQHRTLIEKINPSFFEVTVALCFAYFAQQDVDYAIIEVGLGGRLDSTNIIKPILSVITNIGFDHVDMLGNTLPLIASEKAGIIKPAVPVVISEHQEETAPVFVKAAQSTGSSIVFAENEWEVLNALHDTHYQHITVLSKQSGIATEYQLDLKGTYQQKNLLGVLSAVRILRNLGLCISEANVVDALRRTQEQTALKGRWQTISNHPKIICDTGHNEAGMKTVMANLAQEHYERLHLLFGAMRDKDLDRVLPMLPKDAIYYFCAPDMPRAMEPIMLQKKAVQFGLYGKPYPSIQEALVAALASYIEGDLIFVGGSTFVVADTLKALASTAENLKL